MNTNCIKCNNEIKRWQLFSICFQCQATVHESCKDGHTSTSRRTRSTIDQRWTCHWCLRPDENPELQDIPDTTNDSLPNEETTEVPPLLEAATHLKKKGLKITHLNLCSLRNKYFEINKFLADVPIDVFTCSETKLGESDPSNIYEMNDYNMIRKDSGNTNSGGLICYLRRNIKYTIVDTDITPPGRSEALIVRISVQHIKPIVIITIYNHPNTNKHEFIHYLREILQFAGIMNHETYILGDLNFNLLKTSQFKSEAIDFEAERLQHLMQDYGYDQKINAPTRITAMCISLLDPIFTNNTKLCNTAGTLRITSSDHLLTYVIRDTKCRYGQPTIVNRYNFKNVNFQKILQENYTEESIKQTETINYEKYTPVIIKELNNVQIGTSIERSEHFLSVFENYISAIINKYIPKVRMRIKNKIPEWHTQELEREVNLRNELRRTEEKQIKTNTLQQSTVKLRQQQNNKVNQLKCELERNYYLDKFRQVTSSISIWDVSNDLVGTKRNQKKSGVLSEIKIEGKLTEDKSRIADHTASTILLAPEADMNIEDEVIASVEDTEKYKCTATRDELRRAFRSLRTKHKSSPVYKVIEGMFPIVSLQLLSLINLIIFNASIPASLKIGIIVPIYKGQGSREDILSYRPITVLPFMSKLVEKIIYQKLQSEVCNQLDTNQHGFRQGYSCDTAWNSLSDRCLRMLDRQNGVVAIVFIDLKKAFDTVDHQKLITKIKTKFKINSWLVNILVNYLQNRNVKIKLGDFTSNKYKYRRGCPQGASLSSLLFIMYLNDIKDALVTAFYNLFADDMAMCVGGTTKEELEYKVNQELQRLRTWFLDNGLILNTSKTKVMVLKKPQDKRTITLDAKFGDQNLEQVQQFKYLGIWVDNNMQHKEHVQKMEKKLTTIIKRIHSVKRKITKNVFSLFINTFINSVVDYGITTWSTVGEQSLNKIQERVSNLIIVYYYPKLATLFTKRFWSETSPSAAKIRTRLLNDRRKLNIYKYLDDLNLPTIPERLTYFNILRTFKILKYNNGNLKANFTTSFLSNKKDNIILVVPKSNLKIYNKSFFHRATLDWNKIPSELRKTTHTLDNFKNLLAQWIISKRSEL